MPLNRSRLAAALASLVLPLILLPLREALAVLAILLWLLLCMRAGQQIRRQRPSVPEVDEVHCWVAYASQSGAARTLAERSAQQLRDAGQDVSVVPLEALPWPLPPEQTLLLVVSTYGDGEAPDHARRFLQSLHTHPHDLHHLRYALLGLGDRQYPAFCACARDLEQHLRQQGAQALFETLEADCLDPAVLHQWQRQLAQLSGEHAFTEWQPPQYQPGTLLERHCLNPGSLGAPLYHLKIAVTPLPHWQAGDLVEISPCHAPAAVAQWLARLSLDGQQVMADGQTLAWHLARRQWPQAPEAERQRSAEALLEHLPRLAHRTYSIASIPADGTLDLLVRLVRHAKGGYGLGSGWLCRHSPLGASIDLRIRPNPAFQLPPDSGRLLLIGNGSGLAGLRSHLRERERLQQGGHWLLFGERQVAHDGLLDNELQGWLASGHLARLDRVFSRDAGPHCYVQDRLRDAAEDLRHWIACGGCVLVCGSLQGMGQSVDAVLRGILGSAAVDQLSSEGRYRRDLY